MSKSAAKVRCRPGCIYEYNLGFCDYAGMTGQLRGCPPGPDCTRYATSLAPKKRNRDLTAKPKDPQGGPRKKPVRKPPPGGPGNLSNNETACRLYAEGASDGVIARICGCSPATVFKWRHETGRAANMRRKDHGNQIHGPAGGPG